jgi:hypothetical protein
LLALLFTPKDEENTFLQNIGGILPDCRALHSASFIVTGVRTSNIPNMVSLLPLKVIDHKIVVSLAVV